MVEHSDKNYLNELIKNRRNITYFSDKIPDEGIIKKLLSDTLSSAPVKNNIYQYKIEVYGPEHYEAKKALLLQTICNSKANNVMNSILLKTGKVSSKEKIREMKKKDREDLYGDIILSLNEWDLQDIYANYKTNSQVMAPYLLVYKLHRNRYVPPLRALRSSKNSIASKWYNRDAIVQGSMHAIILSLNASYYDIDHGFCKCYKKIEKNSKNTIFNEDGNDLLFMLGLGYRGVNPPGLLVKESKKWEKPKPEKIYEWM